MLKKWHDLVTWSFNLRPLLRIQKLWPVVELKGLTFTAGYTWLLSLIFIHPRQDVCVFTLCKWACCRYIILDKLQPFHWIQCYDVTRLQGEGSETSVRASVLTHMHLKNLHHRVKIQLDLTSPEEMWKKWYNYRVTHAASSAHCYSM